MTYHYELINDIHYEENEKEMPPRAKEIQNQIEKLQAELEALEAGDAYPVGTVLRVERPYGGDILIIKLDRIHSAFADTPDRNPSETPVWVSIYDDFSGYSDESLTDLKSKSLIRDEHVEVYVP